MLILPAEQSLNWKHPPIATLLLIFINCWVFFEYQSKDIETKIEMISIYQENNLLDYEAEPYLSFVQSQDNHRYIKLLELYKAEPEELTIPILADISFAKISDEMIEASEINQAETAAEDFYAQFDPRVVQQLQYEEDQIDAVKIDYKVWREAREKINDLQKKISAVAHGLIPAEINLSAFITHQFLHGGFDHLLGNMIILFIVGFSIEIAIGRVMYVLFYLLSGIAGGILFSLLNKSSFLPLVGASGAIAGLMGMYLALYGMKKIKFFYWVVFYFNYFRAPALLILPIWLGKEIYDSITAGGNVAYSAHVGGMIGGFMMLYAAKGRVVTVNQDYLEQIDVNEPYRQQLIQLNKLILNLRFNQAKQLCETLLSENPNDLNVLSHYYHLCKLNSSSDEFKEAADHIFELNKRENFLLIHDIYQDYSARHGPPLNNTVNLELARKFIVIDMLRDAEQLLKQVMQQEAHDSLPETILLYAGKLAKEKDPGAQSKLQAFASYLQEYFPESAEAKQIMLLCR